MLYQLERFSNISFVGILVLLLLITPMGRNYGTIYAQSYNECEKQLSTAQKKMETGKFDEAIKLITECLNKDGISNETKKQAYRLLGLTYIAKDYLGDAREAIGKLLDVVPNYQPNPDQDPPSFVNIVNEQIAERSKPVQPVKKPPVNEEKSSNSIWYWIGGGVLVVAAVVIVLLSGGNDTPPQNNDLPEPPDLP